MAARQSPRTMAALASVEPRVRSDFVTFCSGVDNLCAQLSLIIMVFADDLYHNLAMAGGKGNYSARARAYRATRPLRVLAMTIAAAGKATNRCYRWYARSYADQITPDRKKASFDHTK